MRTPAPREPADHEFVNVAPIFAEPSEESNNHPSLALISLMKPLANTHFGGPSFLMEFLMTRPCAPLSPPENLLIAVPPAAESIVNDAPVVFLLTPSTTS